VRRWFWGLLLVLLVATGAAAAWVWRELTTPYYGAPTAEVFVDVPRGASSARIARDLQSAGVLRRGLPFRLFLMRNGSARRLKAGEYRFSRPATPIEVSERLLRGDVYFVAVTVPEGLTAEETFETVVRAGLSDLVALRAAARRTDLIRELDPAAPNLEGYLFPETYHLPRRAGAEQIVAAMVEQFRHVYARLTRERPPLSGWTPRRVVTLASMVEKESAKEAERPLVASVLCNRLARGMPLGCDPTVIYALKLAGRYDGNIRKADLEMDSPYNTYRYPGLPPGPIANPGESSLRAALRPERTDFLYFVSRNDGTHEFSRDYGTHARAVAHFQAGGRR